MEGGKDEEGLYAAGSPACVRVLHPLYLIFLLCQGWGVSCEKAVSRCSITGPKQWMRWGSEAQVSGAGIGDQDLEGEKEEEGLCAAGSPAKRENHC